MLICHVWYRNANPSRLHCMCVPTHVHMRMFRHLDSRNTYLYLKFLRKRFVSIHCTWSRNINQSERNRHWCETRVSRISNFLISLPYLPEDTSIYLPTYPMYPELPVQYSFLLFCRRLPIWPVWRCDPSLSFNQSSQSVNSSVTLSIHQSDQSYLAQKPRSSMFVCVCVCHERMYVCNAMQLKRRV